jgi:hypothetical protein
LLSLDDHQAVRDFQENRQRRHAVTTPAARRFRNAWQEGEAAVK